jgi:hypothetical protein
VVFRGRHHADSPSTFRAGSARICGEERGLRWPDHADCRPPYEYGSAYMDCRVSSDRLYSRYPREVTDLSICRSTARPRRRGTTLPSRSRSLSPTRLHGALHDVRPTAMGSAQWKNLTDRGGRIHPDSVLGGKSVAIPSTQMTPIQGRDLDDRWTLECEVDEVRASWLAATPVAPAAPPPDRQVKESLRRQLQEAIWPSPIMADLATRCSPERFNFRAISLRIFSTSCRGDFLPQPREV